MPLSYEARPSVLAVVLLTVLLLASVAVVATSSTPAAVAGSAGPISVAASPALTVSPTSGHVGQTLTFNGTGYAGSSSVTVSWTYGTACTATSSSAGKFSCTYQIPATYNGAWTFTGTDASSNSASATFTVIQELTVSPTAGPAGTTVTFVGTGYDSPDTVGGAQVYITWMSGSVQACDVGTNGQGSMSCTYEIPAGTSTGSYTFTGADNTPHTATASFTVTYSPVLTVSPTSGHVGQTLTFNGTGYADSSAISVGWNYGTACTATSTAKGNFSCTYQIPATYNGAWTFTATDANSGAGTATFTVIQELTVSPTSGPAGTTVTFVGTGYDSPDTVGGAQVWITWMSGSVQACDVGTNGQGSMSCTYVIPAGTATGSHTFTGADNTPHTATAAFKVTYSPVLTVSPTSGHVGQILTFNGTGYAHSSAITVGWNYGTACTATSNKNGNFSCSFQLPATYNGAWTFTGTDASSGMGTATFTVIQQLTMTPTSGPAGTTVTFVGTGYDSPDTVGGAQVWITWMSGSVQACDVGTSAQGSMSCTYVIPAGTATGSYTFTGADNTPHTSMAVFSVSYTPVLTVSPTSGHVGRTLTFNGTGFADSSAIIVSWAFGTACTATSSASGKFSCAFQIPATYNGPWTFTATDANSAAATTTFTVVQQLTVSPTSGPAGTTVTFVATGYDSPDTVGGAQVWITWMSGSVQACDVGTNGQGSMSCTYQIPATPAGTYTFTGADNTPHTATAAFAVEPTLTVSPTTGLVGTTVTFNGTSYAASSSVSVTWSRGTACTSTANTAGDFSCSYTIPAFTVGGSYTFTGKDAASNKATAVFTDSPHLTISRSPDTVAKTVTFSGKGFNDSAPVVVSWSKGTACSATTSGSGTFSCTFKIPATAVGSYTFNATDENDNSAKTTLKIVPALTATPTSGAVGSTVTFSGTGFTGSSAVSVNWSSGVACVSTTGKAGSFACSFVVPATTGGLYTFTATDAASENASATFTVDAAMTAFPTSGAPGTIVTFNGTGYAATSAVTVSWSSGTACTAISTADGNFTCEFTIPAGTATGSYTFTGTDAQSNAATASFKVT